MKLMKSTLILLSLITTSFSVSSIAHASELGDCQLRGTQRSAHLTFLPWDKEKELIQNVSLDQCVEAAKAMLQKTRKETITLQHRFRPHIKNYEEIIRIKRVKYTFTTETQIIKGSIQK